MPEPARLALVFIGLAVVSCGLGRADVVMRSPDLDPGSSAQPNSDAADAAGEDATAGSEANADARDEPEDGLADRAVTADVSPSLDGRDTLGQLQRDALARRSDTACSRDAGDECGASALVMIDDFEDGAAGWMSTGTIWMVTADPTSPRPNSVLSPTGPAASSVYYADGAWQDMTAEVRLRVTSFGKASSANRAELYARYQDAEHFYALSLRSDGYLVLRRNASTLGTAAAVSVAAGGWHFLALRVSGPAEEVSIEGYLDGVLMVTATDTEALLPALGTVGVGIYGETVAVFDDVSVSSP